MSMTSYERSGLRPFAAFRSVLQNPPNECPGSLVGRLSAIESTDAFTVLMDVPGCSESDVSVTLNDGLLTIEGDRKARIPEGGREIYSDRDRGPFRRVLKLREPVQSEAIDATIENGVLRIRLPRVPEVRPQKIAIRASGQIREQSSESSAEQPGGCAG